MHVLNPFKYTTYESICVAVWARLSLVNSKVTPQGDWYNQGNLCHWRTCQKFHPQTEIATHMLLALGNVFCLSFDSTWGKKLSKLSKSAPVALRVPHWQPHLSTCGQQDRERPHSVKPGGPTYHPSCKMGSVQNPSL